MVLEVAEIEIVTGQAEDFIAAYRKVRDLLTGTPGCRTVRMTRGVESPHRFLLLVEWDDIVAHEKNFRDTERSTAWRAAIGSYFAGPPHAEHVTDVD